MSQVRIVYLEDSADDAELVRATLVRSGLDVDLRIVQSREQFTAALAAGEVDVVMSDNAIAGFSGRGAMEQVQRQCPGTPVILLSGYVDEAEAARCLEAGAADYLSKDELWRLPHVVRRAMRQASQGQAAHARQTGWERLVSVVQELSMARDLDNVMRIVRRAARELTGADGATFVLREDDKCFYAEENAIAPLWKGKRFPMSACISGWVMLNRRPAVIEDIYSDPRIPAEAYRPTFVKSLAMVPIRTQSPIGAIGNYWATRRTPTEQEVALLSALADTTSVAMENIQLYEELEQRVRERTRELEAANKELEAFSYSVSHDLRAPIRAINGFTAILRDCCGEHLGDQGQETLGRIEAAAGRMNTLIDALLSLARVTRADMNTQRVDISALAHDVVAVLQLAHPGRQVQVDIAPGLVAQADPALLRIVLENLLSNAWKYTAAQPDARVEVGQSSASPPTFFVRDNGVGFDMAYAHRLFSPFQRLHSESAFPGTGVGLATVQRIIHRHGGQVTVTAAPDHGATFSFTLPA